MQLWVSLVPRMKPLLTPALQTDAWTFLVGSAASTLTNIVFIYVLCRFPAFLRHVKREGAEPDVVVRLSMFYEMNV